MGLAALDSYSQHLRPTRALLLQIVSPLYFIAEAPYAVGNSLSESLTSRENLLAQIQRQRQQLLTLSHTAQRYQTLKADNDRMRALLGSKEKLPGSVLIAEIVSVRSTPSAHQVIIDKGSVDGLQVGQAVLDAEGLFGQLVEVGRSTSRVLLLIDKDHAVPVQVTRNGARKISLAAPVPETIWYWRMFQYLWTLVLATFWRLLVWEGDFRLVIPWGR